MCAGAYGTSWLKIKERHVSKKSIFCQLKGPAHFFLKKMVLHSSTASREHFFLKPNKVLLYSAVMFANMTAPYESTLNIAADA
jgi:hypothetical protein